MLVCADLHQRADGSTLIDRANELLPVQIVRGGRVENKTIASVGKGKIGSGKSLLAAWSGWHSCTPLAADGVQLCQTDVLTGAALRNRTKIGGCADGRLFIAPRESGRSTSS